MDGLLLDAIAFDDYEAILALWRTDPNIRLSEADSPENFRRFLARNPGSNFKVRDGLGVVGTILCGHDGRRGYLHHLFVDGRSRKRGVGRRLVLECFRFLESESITKIHIFLLPSNRIGQQFWKRMGFQQRTSEEFFVFSKDLLLSNIAPKPRG